MGYDYDGLSLFIEHLEKIHDLSAGLGVECSCRLICEDKVRVVDQRAGYGHPLLFPTGKL